IKANSTPESAAFAWMGSAPPINARTPRIPQVTLCIAVAPVSGRDAWQFHFHRLTIMDVLHPPQFDSTMERIRRARVPNFGTEFLCRLSHEAPAVSTAVRRCGPM